MAWESRNGRGRYYTRSKRVNGQVVREYIGTGPRAEMIAESDALKHRERVATRRAMKTAMGDIESTSELLGRYHVLTEGLVRIVLIQAGYHRHHRGKWRKRRGR